MHNSRRPLDCLTVTVTLTFDLIFISGRVIMMDYPCAKFGDFSFSRFGFITESQTDRITDNRYTHATLVMMMMIITMSGSQNVGNEFDIFIP